MKIVIPVDEEKVDSPICISFGRAPYFLIYDTENKASSFIDNSVAVSSQGGAGIKAAQVVVDQEVDVLLTPRCGENAAEVFKSANVQIFKTTSTVVKQVIEEFLKGNLSELTDIHSGLHNHGGN